MSAAAYQLLWLGEPGSSWLTALDAEVQQGFRDLGVPPEDTYSLLTSVAEIDWHFPVSCVWAAEGEEVPEERRLALDEVIRRAVPIFPVIEKLKDFGRLMPKPLLAINGMAWERGAQRLAAEVLNSFGLARQVRSVFISYMRRHSRAAAVQVLHELTDHGYLPFLDTASVEFGDQFQETLWDKMADADFLLFLDTPGALSSTWVDQELTRAHNLGMATLRVQWPARKDPETNRTWNGTAGTDMSWPFELAEKDFDGPAWTPVDVEDSIAGEVYDGQKPNPLAALRAETLAELAKLCEKVRMRSIGARRARLAGEIQHRAGRAGLTAVVDGTGPVRILSGDQVVAGALPVIGFPDSGLAFRNKEAFDSVAEPIRMVYDDLGIKPDRADYLTWLNDQLQGYQSNGLGDLNQWLKTL